ncbi:hypothetical protein [Pyruvatibacter sp.]
MGAIIINVVLLIGAAVLYAIGETWVPLIVGAVAGTMLGMELTKRFGPKD